MSSPVAERPHGRYLAWEAGQLAGVSGTTVGQWARRGYVRSSVRSTEPRIYSYQDVAEAMVVHELLERGVPHRDIGRAIELLRDHGDWPLTHAPLATTGEGRARIVVRAGTGTYEVGGRGWQQVLSVEYLQEVSDQLRRGGWAVRRLPDLEHVEVHPARLHGRPTIRGRRLAVVDVAEMAEGPEPVEDLAESYELQPEQIEDAGRWWREVRRLAA